MRWKPKPQDAMASTRRAYVGEASLEYLFALMVTGDLLVLLLNRFQFPDSVISVLTHVVTFSCAMQVMALFFAGRPVKRVVTAVHILNQACFVLLYFVPSVPLPPGAKPAVFLTLFILGHLLNNLVNPPKIAWLMRSVPDGQRGRFTAVKEMISLAAGMLLTTGIGAFADHMKALGSMEAYYIICGVGLAAVGVLHTVTLLISKEPPMPHGIHPQAPKAAIRQLLHCPAIGKVMAVGVFWNVAIGFSVGSFAVYKQNELSFTMLQIAVMATVGSFCRLALSPVLGKFADKYSFSRCMTLCLGIAALGFLVNTFTVPQTKWLHLVYICLYYMSMAGINSGSINLIFDFVPFAGRQAAMGLKNAIGGVLGFVSALIGGILLGAIQDMGGLPFFGITLYAQQLLSFISFVLILLLILYMLLVIFPLQKKRERDIAMAFSLEEEYSDM